MQSLMQGIGWRSRQWQQRIRRWTDRFLTRPQSEDELAAVTMQYWNEGDRRGVDLGDYSHWRDRGPWVDRARWQALGRIHLDMADKLRAHLGRADPFHDVVEWGCGGGANAIHFAGTADRFCGVEISKANLDECARVLAEQGFTKFEPVLIDASAPEAVLGLTAGRFDLFLSTYVFELIPGRMYGERIARLGLELLKPGGVALIQIRYDDGTERSRQHSSDYFGHADRFTSYRIEDFWRRMESIGFRPLYVELITDRREGFSGDLYAYFALLKPAA